MEVARLEGDVHYGGEGFEVGEFSEHYSGEFDDPIAGRKGRFEVINEINIYDCRDREDRESRFGDLEDLEPPCFNRDLPGIDFSPENGVPGIGQFSIADETLNELGEYNMLLVDQMYNAYNEKADALVEKFNTGEGSANLRELEHEREHKLKVAQEEVKAAGHLYSVEQHEEEEVEDTVPIRRPKGPKEGMAPLPPARGAPKASQKRAEERLK